MCVGLSLSQASEASDGGARGATERMPKRTSGEQEVKGLVLATGRMG